jgi:hypothetical protein
MFNSNFGYSNQVLNSGHIYGNICDTMNVITRGKSKIALCLSNEVLRHQGLWGSGCIDPYFLDLGTSWRQVVSFTPRSLYPRGKTPGTHSIGSCVDPRISLTIWRIENSGSYWDSNSDPSVVQPLASRYTDYAIPAPYNSGKEGKIFEYLRKLSHL